jgi:hypothetical protein
VLLVFANKSDCVRTATGAAAAACMSAAQIAEKLNLQAIKTHSWHIQSAESTHWVNRRDVRRYIELTLCVAFALSGCFRRSCCAITGEGLFDGMEWVTQSIAQART